MASSLSLAAIRRLCSPGTTNRYSPPTASRVMQKNSRARRLRSDRCRLSISVWLPGPGRARLQLRVAEPVARAADREQVVRILGVVLDLLAQVPDMHVD